jgi:acyl-coenzyme A thioesterase PaaI-like protein
MSTENYVLTQWNRLAGLPAGKWLFSKIVAARAPYFKTIHPLIEELRPNYAKVRLTKQRALENHIGTVHVIAICNLLELAMGACAEASIPKHLRWIPKGMRLEYTAKAGSDITGVAEINPEDWKPGDLDVKVTAYDTSGVVVVKGVIGLWISEKKR